MPLSVAREEGCDAVNGTMFGYGERCGNPPVEGGIIEYISLKGDLCGTQPEVITELAAIDGVMAVRAL